jgi:hypothetical protein
VCDRANLLNPLHHHPTILPFPQQLVSENPLHSARSGELQHLETLLEFQLFVDRSNKVTEADGLK